MNRAPTEQVKIGLAVGGMLAVGIGFVLARLRARAERNEAARAYLERTPVVRIGRFALNAQQAFVAAIFLFCAFGTVNYQRYSSEVVATRYDEYDLIHYYLNSKYYDELGTSGLLPATIVADHEAGEYCPGEVKIYRYESGEDYTIKPISHALAMSEKVKSSFTPARWKQFVHDFTFIQRDSKGFKCALWKQLLQDHGFNGTPGWVLVARPISSAVPVEYVKCCTFIDVVWIALMLVAIGWAFGGQTVAFAWIFICVSYSFRWPHIPWAFLRYDWLASMVIGVCMIKKEKHVAGGAFFAYATLMRYFPGLWLLGILAKGIHAVFANREVPLTRVWRRVPGKYYRMALGFFGLLAIMLAVSFARDGIETHESSLRDMALHIEPEHLSSMRQGLLVTATYRGETDQKLIGQKRLLAAEMEKPVRMVAFALIVVFCVVVGRAKDWEAVGLAVMPYFWLTTASYYYYVLRMTAVVVHAADLTKWRNVVGLAWLFAIEVFCNLSESIFPETRYFLISWMGIGMVGYSVLMLSFLGHEWWTGRKAIDAPAPARAKRRAS